MKYDYFRTTVKDGTKVKFAYRNCAVPGVYVMEALHMDCACPIGTVWFRFLNRRTLEILHSYVVGQVRRCGLRTRMHQKMLHDHPRVWTVTTDNSTRQSRPWLLKIGFARADDGTWKLNTRKRK